MRISSNDIFNKHNTFEYEKCKIIDNKTKEITNVNMNIYTQNLIPIDTKNHLTHVSPFYLYGELLWYIMGKNDISYINKFSSFWKNIAKNGKVNSNYGYNINEAIGFNQMEYIIEILKQDKLSRRAIIHLQPQKKYDLFEKDIPCTLTLQFLLRPYEFFNSEYELQCISTMRSNDAFYGFSYDIPYFRFLQGYVYNKLQPEVEKLKLGSLYHNVGSFHIYEKDYKAMSFLKDKYNHAYDPFYNNFDEIPEAMLKAINDINSFSLVSIDKVKVDYSSSTFNIIQLLYILKHNFESLKNTYDKINVINILFNNITNSKIKKDKKDALIHTLYFVYCRIRYEFLKKNNFDLDKLTIDEKLRNGQLEEYIYESFK